MTVSAWPTRNFEPSTTPSAICAASAARDRLKKGSGRGPPGSDLGVGARGGQLVRLGEHRLDLLERRLARVEHADPRLRGQAVEEPATLRTSRSGSW
jgi:hypothetical protein